MPRVSFRKLRQWTFATIAIASLVLCLATVGLWVRSYWRADVLFHDDTPRIFSNAGGFTFVLNDSSPATAAWRHEVYETRFVFGPGGYVGFQFTRRDGPYDLLRFPHWSLALLFAIVPTWWGMAIVRARRRAEPGCCVACGYDLRASPDRCPECGTTSAAQP